jgi:hypothetical protein
MGPAAGELADLLSALDRRCARFSESGMARRQQDDEHREIFRELIHGKER